MSDLPSSIYYPSALKERCKAPLFVVIGWFPDANPVSRPIETCVVVDNLQNFLPELKKHIDIIRGWRWLLSFKGVHGFSIYKCRPRYLSHNIPTISDDASLALEQLFEQLILPSGGHMARGCSQGFKEQTRKLGPNGCIRTTIMVAARRSIHTGPSCLY